MKHTTRKMAGQLETDCQNYSEKELADIIYDKLSNEIIPLYYSKETDDSWFQFMIESIKTYFEYFTSDRMAEDYYDNFYQKYQSK